MKLRESLVVNIISLFGYLSFAAYLFYAFFFWYPTLISDDLHNFFINLYVFIRKLSSLKVFILFLCLYILEQKLKNKFPVSKIFKLNILNKFNKKFFYFGLGLYIISLFNFTPGIAVCSYFIIIFSFLSCFISFNPKFGVHNYYSINSLVWNSLLFEILLLLYVLISVGMQELLEIDGIKYLFPFLVCMVLVSVFSFMFCTHILAFFVELIFRKKGKITTYNCINPSKTFRITVFCLSIFLLGLISFCGYNIVTALREID